MPRSIEVSFESPAAVEEVHAVFGRRDYWQDRLAAFGGAKTLEVLDVDSGGTVTVVVSEDLKQDALPGPLAKLYRGDLRVRSTEVWKPVGDGRVRAEIAVAVQGAPGSGAGTALLAPRGAGSELSLSATIEFNVPLVGGRIEGVVARQFADGFADIHRFTDKWIAERA
jgi:hypothetical protein